MSWFSRRGSEPQDLQQVIDQLSAAGGAASGTTTASGGLGPAPTPAGDFLLAVEDVFTITGRGSVITGRVVSGEVSVGQEVTQLRAGVAVRSMRVTGIEMSRTMSQAARVGDNVGLLVQGVGRDEIARGDQLVRRHR